MLLLTSLLIRSSLRGLGASYPIDRDLCMANLNGYKYNFLTLNSRVFTFKPGNEDFTYYISLCKELTPNVVPVPAGSTFDFSDVFVARCNGSLCQALITENSWDWRYLNANEKDNGVNYFAIGEPFKNAPDTYFSFDIEVQATCDRSSTEGPNVSVKYIYDNIDNNEALLQMKFSSEYGCADIVTPPTPTPSPFKPNCDYTDRFDNMTDFGVDIHLTDMNGGPWGVRSVNLSLGAGKSDTILFYQPCERMECPPGYRCGSEKYSSAWLCNDQNQHTCESYGIIDGNGKSFIEPAFNDLLDGLNLTYAHGEENKSITFLLKCDNIMPKNHFLFNPQVEKNGNNLVVNVRAGNSCPQVIPDPTPQPDSHCVFNRTQSEQKSTVFLNLTAHDKADQKGWISDVTWYNSGKKTGKLYYEPCDNAVCPRDAFCEGDEDATIFLCEDGPDGKPDCIAYGLLENRISMNFENFYDVTEGVRVDYTADLQRTANVNWRCDKTLADNIIRMPDTVQLIKNSLSFDVYSKAACGSGNPTPRPPYHPPKPTKPTEPTPTPQPSVNPTDIYVINDTHYILTPLQSYQQQPFKGELNLMGPHPQLEGKVYCEFHPWQLIPCPSHLGYECSAGHTESNFWACWTEDDGSKYCHSIGDVRILNEMEPRNPKNPDLGVDLHFGGVWDMDVHFDIECDPFEDNYSIPFDQATILRFQQGGLLKKQFFTTYLDSGAVCPRKFESIPIPAKTAYQTPAPGYKPEYTYESITNQDGKYIKIDLAGLPVYYDELITLGLHPKFQRNLYRYYPVTPGAAPEGYQILDEDNDRTANVWRCFNSSDGRKVCHTAGDSTVNLIYQIINESNLLSGVSLNYEGGYGGYQTHIQLICNESVPAGRIDFDDVGRLITSQKSPIIFAHTSMACPIDSPYPPYDPTNRGVITGGSIFLTIVVVISVLYLTIGVLINFIKDGVISIPNSEFWQEVGQCIHAAVIFIGTCGKRSGDISYEKTI
ncbi:hypothetical protein TRFO_12685 [Tritrichomonas foetus]|uniref:MRH domain-containing protein n=1 Tax=Tritrichomonas foetus TaxID=1144522 RepID=A0A1J4L163_9EUKA|nr:hypothetical protein TRFO_12685 [Tritrichomonas foetus]|eukprot:OHT17154.1 hypothetical protein TRFO_12685 [Tritrichomonas foetus]